MTIKITQAAGKALTDLTWGWNCDWYLSVTTAGYLITRVGDGAQWRMTTAGTVTKLW